MCVCVCVCVCVLVLCISMNMLLCIRIQCVPSPAVLQIMSAQPAQGSGGKSSAGGRRKHGAEQKDKNR